MRNFRELTIWKDAIALAKNVYSLAETLPAKEKFGLSSQICRAAVSIPSNIAEGCSRSSDLEVKRFFEIAIGSSFEVETQFILIAECHLIDNDSVKERILEVRALQVKINAFIERIRERM